MTTIPSAESALVAGLGELGIEWSPERIGRCLAYLELVRRFGRSINLSGNMDAASMVTRHVLDSLSAAPWLSGGRVVDFGSGAGFPGVPLALNCPSKQFTLLDSRTRRTEFIAHATATIGIENVGVVTARAEDYRAAEKFDTLIARAVASAPDLLRRGMHLVARPGRIIVMKAAAPEAEETDAVVRLAGVNPVVEPVNVPGLERDRHLVIIDLDDGEAVDHQKE